MSLIFSNRSLRSISILIVLAIFVGGAPVLTFAQAGESPVVTPTPVVSPTATPIATPKVNQETAPTPRFSRLEEARKARKLAEDRAAAEQGLKLDVEVPEGYRAVSVRVRQEEQIRRFLDPLARVELLWFPFVDHLPKVKSIVGDVKLLALTPIMNPDKSLSAVWLQATLLVPDNKLSPFLDPYFARHGILKLGRYEKPIDAALADLKEKDSFFEIAGDQWFIEPDGSISPVLTAADLATPTPIPTPTPPPPSRSRDFDLSKDEYDWDYFDEFFW